MKAFSLAIFLFSLNALALCPSDKGLERMGFTVYKKDFQKHYRKVTRSFEDDQQHYIEDLSGTIHSSVAGVMVRIESFDDLRTPQREMFGDVVFMETVFNVRPVEVRWFAKGKKFVAYDSTFQSCATASVPLAENALF